MTPLFCPFCGNEPDEPEYHCKNGNWSVPCWCCEYDGPVGHTRDRAIAAWNERHHPYEADIRQLKKELAAFKERKANNEN